jgi:photosynthetic reaction center H subunit
MDEHRTREHDERRSHSSESRTDRTMKPIDDFDDIKVVKDDPDVRGWDVYTQERRKFGKVHTLIVDDSAMTVRYLDVDINKELLSDRDHHHVLIPIGMARLDTDDKNVLLDDVIIADLLRLPSYEHGKVTPEYESRLRDTLMSEGEVYGSQSYYDQSYFDRERFYSREGSGRTGESASGEPRRPGSGPGHVDNINR